MRILAFLEHRQRELSETAMAMAVLDRGVTAPSPSSVPSSVRRSSVMCLVGRSSRPCGAGSYCSLANPWAGPIWNPISFPSPSFSPVKISVSDVTINEDTTRLLASADPPYRLVDVCVRVIVMVVGRSSQSYF